jgi:hypothetical protein
MEMIGRRYRTLNITGSREVDDPTRLKRHFLLSRTANRLPTPIQDERLLVKVLPFAHGPGFARDLKFSAALTHQMATQIGPVDMQLFHCHRLPLQIRTDLSGDARFWNIRGRDAYCTDQACIQIVEHMPFVSIHPHAPAFSSMPHLSVFDTDR